jgi:carbon monoxide dehydrogenase subunit G
MAIHLGVSHEFAFPAADIWSVMGDFRRLPDWFPGLQQFTADGNVPGDTRRIMLAGVTIIQQLLAQDATGMRTTYQIVDAPGITRDTGFVVTITVSATAEAACKVDWRATLAKRPDSVPEGAESAFVTRTEQNYRAALAYFLTRLDPKTT